MVTAYDYPSGRIADAAGIDIVLVGDSAAMTVLGNESTVPATMDEMLMLTRAAARGAERPLVVADMPFGSFQVSDEDAVRNAVRFVKEAGADAVKLEGAGPTLSRVLGARRRRHPRHGPRRADAAVRDDARRLPRAGPHRREGAALLQDARALEAGRLFRGRPRGGPRAGRGADHGVAHAFRPSASAPGADCDGQVLVFHDLLGLYDGKAPRFVKRYADLAAESEDALERYAADVRSGAFPGDEHTYSIPEDELAAFEALSAARERNQERKRDDQQSEHDERERDERAHGVQRSTTEIP